MDLDQVSPTPTKEEETDLNIQRNKLLSNNWSRNRMKLSDYENSLVKIGKYFKPICDIITRSVILISVTPGSYLFIMIRNDFDKKFKSFANNWCKVWIAINKLEFVLLNNFIVLIDQKAWYLLKRINQTVDSCLKSPY